MTADLIKFAFVGGEVAEAYHGRADLEKFDLAMAIAENWFVDYHGGLSTSPGFEMQEFVMNDSYPTKFFAFKFASNVANTNLILFGKDYIRFLQDGAYVLEDSKTIVSITQANPGVMTINVHGYVEGDWIQFPAVGEMVELAGRTCRVGPVSGNTFQLQDQFGNNLDTSGFTAYVSGGEAARVYTLASPYAAEDLKDLRGHQTRDTIKLVHPSYKPYRLTRNDQADWALALEDFVSPLERPHTISHNTLRGGTFAVAFVVTQVNDEGLESLPSDYYFITDVVDYERVGDGGAVLQWTPLVGASYYRIYRTRIANDPQAISRSYQVGYIGQSKGGHFVDNGITPDFAQTPPTGNNPFADGKIIGVDVVNGGTGYGNTDTVTVTDPNPNAGGFIGYAIIANTPALATGPLAGIYVVDGGHDYTNPTFTVSGGSGALLSARLGAQEGNYPHTVTVAQQRQLYGALDNKPLNVFGSRPGKLSDFGFSEIVVANDSYEHEIDAEDASPINHLLPTRGGVLVFSSGGIWLMAGTNGASISATDVQADPQSYKGASALPPLKVDTEILFADTGGGSIKSLAYNDAFKIYAGPDVSILASHMFGKNKEVIAWGYAEEPYKMVWGAREDGIIVNMTILREQEVYAWTRRLTRGKVVDLIVLEEENNSSVYLMVQRKINGRKTKFIERVARRDFENVEDAFCVDCGLQTSAFYPPFDIEIAAKEGAGILVTATGFAFSAGDVGKIFRFGGGKGKVASYISPAEITVDFVRPITDLVPFTETPRDALAGEWTLDAEFTVVSGLHHLEGEAVAVLADGNVVTGLTVNDGSITLPQAASRVIVGLSYRCTAKNLPLNSNNIVIENKRKRAVALAIRTMKTRGLRAGNALTDLYPIKEVQSGLYGEAAAAYTGLYYHLMEPIWSEDGQSYLVQDDPLPATVLGYVAEVEVGDDPN